MRTTVAGFGSIIAVLLGLAIVAPVASAGDGFVTRKDSTLLLEGKPFRFAGANVEWLGLVGYGPMNFTPEEHQRFPTKFEIDDALSTVKEMGGRVVRAQTLGDTVGCPNCLQPKLGVFNEAAFRVFDYVVMRAGELGLKVQAEFVGDSRSHPDNGGLEGTVGIWKAWHDGANFYTDPIVWRAFARHVTKVVTRVNSLTGVPYNEDPTIMGWIDCNGCGGFDPEKAAWVQKVAALVKELAPRQLTIAHANVLAVEPAIAADPNVDAIGNMVYPHWFQAASGVSATGDIPVPQANANLAASFGKVFYMSEIGWDGTNWLTDDAWDNALRTIERDPNITGDLVWALESHADGHGWKALPSDQKCQPAAFDEEPASDPGNTRGIGCFANEDGNWWALYYTGRTSRFQTKEAMSRRAQLYRGHGFRMSDRDVPPPSVPPAPTRVKVDGERAYWQGSVGGAAYTVQTADRRDGPWTTLCDGCTDDSANGWRLPPEVKACVRVVAHGVDGRAGPASEPTGPASSCGPPPCQPRTVSIKRSLLPRRGAVKIVVDGNHVVPVRRAGRLRITLRGTETGRSSVSVYVGARRVRRATYRVCRLMLGSVSERR